MYVDGKYISRKHPLYKPGRYKTFNDATFSSLVNYVLSTEGRSLHTKEPCLEELVQDRQKLLNLRIDVMAIKQVVLTGIMS